MSSSDRQRIVRVGSRRVRLTPAPGTIAEPLAQDDTAQDDTGTTDAGTDAVRAIPASGPNDERLRNEVPPHW